MGHMEEKRDHHQEWRDNIKAAIAEAGFLRPDHFWAAYFNQGGTLSQQSLENHINGETKKLPDGYEMDCIHAALNEALGEERFGRLFRFAPKGGGGELVHLSGHRSKVGLGLGSQNPSIATKDVA